MLLPRTIDKARAAVRGGDLGDYHLTPGLSASLLREIGMTEAEFVHLVRHAADEDQVANAVAERVPPARRERWNEALKNLHVADLAEAERERFLTQHDAHDDDLVVYVLVADDRRSFPPGRVRGLYAAPPLAVQRRRDDGAQAHGGVANLVGRDDERRHEAQRVAPGGVDEKAMVEPARDEAGRCVPITHRQPEHEAEATYFFDGGMEVDEGLDIELGSQGEDVRAFQARLAERGWRVPVDGLGWGVQVLYDVVTKYCS